MGSARAAPRRALHLRRGPLRGPGGRLPWWCGLGVLTAETACAVELTSGLGRKSTNTNEEDARQPGLRTGCGRGPRDPGIGSVAGYSPLQERLGCLVN